MSALSKDAPTDFPRYPPRRVPAAMAAILPLPLPTLEPTHAPPTAPVTAPMFSLVNMLLLPLVWQADTLRSSINRDVIFFTVILTYKKLIY